MAILAMAFLFHANDRNYFRKGPAQAGRNLKLF